MALNSIMSSALTGLFTSQTGLAVTSNNIANVNTPNYSREVVRQEAIVNGTSNSGVKISGIERVVDAFLDTASLAANSDNSRYNIENQFHERFQGILGRPDLKSSLSGRLDTMFTKMADLAVDPGSSILRQNVLSGIEDFTSTLSNLSDQLQSLRADASSQIQDRVAKINSAIEQIVYLNPLITKETALNHSTGSLEGQRSQALATLSALVDIRTVDRGNGAIAVTTSNGVTLLDGSTAYVLQYKSPATATAETTYPPITLAKTDPATGQLVSTGVELDGAVQSGELRGLLDMRDKILPDMANELGHMASEFADSINGLSNSFTSFPAPNQLQGRNVGLNAADPQGFTGKATFAIVGADGTVVRKTTVDFDALGVGATMNDVTNAVNAGLGADGTLSLVNGVMTFTAANSANGVVISQDATTPSDRAGHGFAQYFGMNDMITARVPATYNTGVNGADAHGFTAGGTINIQLRNSSNKLLGDYILTIPAGGTFNDLLTDLNGTSALGKYATFSLDANGALVMTPKPGIGDLNINVPTDSTSRGASQKSMSSLFGIGERYIADPASDLRVITAMKTNANLIPLATFDQTAGVGQVAMTKGDQSGIQAFQALQNKSLDFTAVGSLSAFKGTFNQYASAFLSNAGLMASTSSSRQQDTGALKSEIDKRKTDVSGVNLDEELSNMIIYQNAYNASARVITTVQQLYDTLLSAVR